MKVLSSVSQFSHYADDVKERLTRSLDRTSRGFPNDLITPLISRSIDPDAGRLERVIQVSNFLFPTGYEWLDDIEIDQEQMIGSYSIMLPYEGRKEQVYQYFNQKQIRPSRDAFDYASKELASLVTSRLHATSFESAYDSMPRGTNLGLPFLSSDSKYREGVLELARFISRQGFTIESDPCVLYWRGQPKGIGIIPKQRTVWGFPHYNTIFGLAIQKPLLNYLRKDMSFSAWVSNEAVDEAVSVIIDHTEHDILSIDYHAFDASCNQIVIDRVFSIVRSWFSSSDWSLIDYIRDTFLGIGLWTPEGILTDRHGGIPSGDTMTNVMGGLINRFIMFYIAFRLRNRVLAHLVQGDDGVVMFERAWSLDDVTSVASELGMEISSDKGGVSKDMVLFLQNIHHTSFRKDGKCVGIRPVMHALNGMLSYERFHKHWNSYDDSVRWWQQLESCRWHPAFSKFVSFLYDNDTYSREYDIHQIVKRAGGREKVESALGMPSFPYGKVPLSKLDQSAVATEMRRLRLREAHKVERG